MVNATRHDFISCARIRPYLLNTLHNLHFPFALIKECLCSLINCIHLSIVNIQSKRLHTCKYYFFSCHKLIVQRLNTELAQRLLILLVNIFSGIVILANTSSDKSNVVSNAKISSERTFILKLAVAMWPKMKTLKTYSKILHLTDII